MQITKGSTDVSLELFVVSNTTNDPETGILFEDVTLNYRRGLSAPVSNTGVSLASVSSAHTDWGWVEVGQGRYRVDLPDAAVATGEDMVHVGAIVSGAWCYIHHIQLIEAPASETTILAAIAAVDTKLTLTATTVPIMATAESLSLIRGDAYDGLSNAVLTWTASQDVDAKVVNFTVRTMAGVILFDQDTAGVTTLASTTTVTVSLASSVTALLPLGNSKFDLEIEMGTDSYWTPARGIIFTVEDQTQH
jgi:hypothetical protein